MSELLDLAEKIAAQARGSEQIEVAVTRRTDVEARAAKGDLESFSSATSEGVVIKVVHDGRVGSASVGSLEPPYVEEALAEARDNARFTTPDELAALPEPDGVPPVPVDRWRDDVGTTPVADKVALAIDLERRIVAADPRISGVRAADYSDTAYEMALASSTGIACYDRGTQVAVGASVLADDGDATRTGYGYSVGLGFADVDPDRVVREGVERTLRMLGASKPATGTMTVVLDPQVGSSVLGVVASLCNGESVLKGRSMFAGRMGEVVAVPQLTLVEDPTDSASLNARTYDSEGLACRRTVLVQDGVLSGFLYDTRWARAAGARSTASAVGGGIGARAVAPAPGPLSQEEILRAVGDGLYVQAVSGLHSGVNPVSGDFSVGAEGLVIRDGQLAEPVNELTIASTLQRMLQSILHIGNDLEWASGAAPHVTLAIADLQVGGQ